MTMSLTEVLEEALRKGVVSGEEMTPLEMVQYLEKRAGELPRVLEHLHWVCQTIHQAYHTDEPGTWIVCPKSICESSARLFNEVIKWRKDDSR